MIKRNLEIKNKKMGALQITTIAIVIVLIFLFTVELGSFILLKTRLGNLAQTNATEGNIEDLNYDTGLLGANTDWFAQNVLHPYLGFVQNPNSHPNINKLGFKGTNPIQKRSKNKIIIGIFGGSVAEEFGSKYSTHLTDLLKKNKQFSDKEISFVNIALGGFKQPQQLLALNYFLALGGEFDIIINLDGFNEAALPYRDNFPDIAPFYPRLWKTYSRKKINPVNLELISKIEKKRSQQIKINEVVLNSNLKKSSFVKIFHTLINRKLTNSLNKLNNTLELSLKTEDTEYQTTGPVTKFTSMEKYWDSLVDIWKISSIQMHHLSFANNIYYFHFLQPNQYLPDSKHFSKEEAEIAFADTEVSEISPWGVVDKVAVENVYPRMIQAKADFENNKLRFYNLTQVFKNTSGSIYVDNCCHYNSAGNLILAQEIANIVGKNYK